MSSRSRFLGLVSLVVGSAFVLGTACSSDDNKKKVPYSPEAGAAGEVETGGKPNGGSGGSGGSTPQAGQGGALEEAGAGGMLPVGGGAGEGGAAPIGAAGEGGAGGMLAACTTSGSAVGVVQGAGGGTVTVCRGARIALPFSATSADTSFTCCATSTTLTLPEPSVVGVGSVEGPFGNLLLLLPESAEYGTQTLSIACGTSTASDFTFDVTDAQSAPVITGTDGPVSAGNGLTISGQNLTGVSNIALVDTVAGTSYTCSIETQQTDSILCYTDSGTPPGDYSLVVQANNCGFAVDSPTVTVNPVPTL